MQAQAKCQGYTNSDKTITRHSLSEDGKHFIEVWCYLDKLLENIWYASDGLKRHHKE